MPAAFSALFYLLSMGCYSAEQWFRISPSKKQGRVAAAPFAFWSTVLACRGRSSSSFPSPPVQGHIWADYSTQPPPDCALNNGPPDPADITFLEQAVLDLGGKDVLELIYAHG